MFVATVYGLYLQQKKNKNGGLRKTSWSWSHIFFYELNRGFFLYATGKLWGVFDCFKSSWNVYDAHKYTLSTIVDLYYFFDWWNFWAHFLGAQTNVPVSKMLWLRPWIFVMCTTLSKYFTNHSVNSVSCLDDICNNFMW